MERAIRIYLSGQMRGLPNMGKTRFNLAELHLQAQGHEVFVPGRGCSGVVDLRTVFLIDMTVILSWAEAVVLVERDSFYKSKGVMAEMTTALAAGVQVWQPDRGTNESPSFSMLDQIEGPYRRIEGYTGARVSEGVSQMLTTDAFRPSILGS